MTTRNKIHQELSRRIFSAERGLFELPREKEIAARAVISSQALASAAQRIQDKNLLLADLPSVRRELRERALAAACDALRTVYTLDDALS